MIEVAAGQHSLQKKVGLAIFQTVQMPPHFIGVPEPLNANGGRFHARLEQPRARCGLEKAADLFVVKNRREFRHGDAKRPCLKAHGQLVAKIARGALSNTGQAKMFP